MATQDRGEAADDVDERPPGRAALDAEFFDGDGVASLSDYLDQLDAMAEETRFTVLYLLADRGELPLSELERLLDRESNALHHHLRTLLRTGLVERRKRRVDDRRRSFYRLTAPGEDLVEPLLALLGEERASLERYR